jgi:hypothetical protein
MPTTLFDYYKSKGQALPSLQERTPLYTQYGGQGAYTGTAEQNNFLLGKLTTQSTVPAPVTSTPITSSNGQSPLDLTKSIDGSTSTQPTPISPVVGTSDSERMKEKLKAFQDQFGMGVAPTAPVVPIDQTKLTTAQTERDAIAKRGEEILAEKQKLNEQLKVFKQTAGEGVSEVGRAGMVSEKERGIQNQLDSLNNEELVMETKLRNRNTVISEIMQTQKQNYQDAVQQYNTQFSESLQLYNLFDKQDDELKTNAKASLDVLAKSYQAQIEAGKLNIGSLTGIQKAKLEEYETQAGLPLGSTLAVLQTLKPAEEKLYSGVDKAGNFIYITKNAATGAISTKKITNVEAPKAPPVTQQKTAIQNTLKTGVAPSGQKIGAPMGKDGYVDPYVYITAFQNWSGSAKDFLAEFPVKTNVNPASYSLLPEAIRPSTRSL